MDEVRLLNLLKAGQAAAQAGRKAEARRKFRAVLRLDSQNTTAMLWLAWLSDDPRAALAYVERAATHDSHSPRIRAALAWARRQVELAEARTRLLPLSTVAPTPAQGRWRRTAAVAILCLLAALAGGILARSLPPDPRAMAEAAVTTPQPAPLVETASPTRTPNPTATPSPLPTWTPTPSPSPTPIPLPTVTPQPVTPTEPVTLIPATLVPLQVLIANEEHWIEVDLSDQVLNAYEGQKLVLTTSVSTGLPRTPTPTGTFSIYAKLRHDDMSGVGYYLRNVPYVMYFYRGYALHGTYWHTNFGRPASHGCVNIPTEQAEWLFSWAEVGTVVHIHD